jgi:phosphate transport system permease protein
MSNIEQGIYRSNVQKRNSRGLLYQRVYFTSLILALIALIVLLVSIVNQAFGLVAVSYEVTPETLDERPLEELDSVRLADIIATTGAINENAARNRLIVFLRDNLSTVTNETFASSPASTAMGNSEMPEGTGDTPIRDLTLEQLEEIAALNISQEQLLDYINTQILRPTVNNSWSLLESVFNRTGIEHFVEERYADGELIWRSWLTPRFIGSPLSTVPSETGLLPALLGSLILLVCTMVVALPLGLGAAIYLEEYATDNWLNRIIETNIRNLAGVPSIIYGMLGLAIFVNALGSITQGRTILSAAFTVALLILPLIIVNSQEALRAVPSSIREASYGLGATQWQTISRQILPAAVPGIMTGSILALARAIGETAPLVVIGVATFINTNPTGPFSRFTALPMLIYNWTSQPNPQYRNIAAAAIILLLILMLTLNSTAIIIRNRASNRRF